MIQKWLLTLTLLVLGILFFASTTWFEDQKVQVEQINDGNRQTIRELQDVKQTTKWLREIIIPYFSTMPLSKHDAELDMIRFYDQYSKPYNLKVSKFIYYDDSAKMDIGFSFIPKNEQEIDRFLSLRYHQGFLQIQTLTIKEGVLSGVLTIIQPMRGVTNASGQ